MLPKNHLIKMFGGRFVKTVAKNMPPTETRVFEKQLVTSWPKEQFS